MCELFAMSSRYPADISFSLECFARHGGFTAPHKDGWGIAFHDGHNTQIFREPTPAANSPTVNFIRSNAFSSKIAISHIRLATRGEVSLRNTQPFQRPLCGRVHVFAHNGDLLDLETHFPLRDCHFSPIGNTDSEYAFCLLQRLQALWGQPGTPDLRQRYTCIAEFARDLRPLGTANFIYSDGEYVFLHGHKRSQSANEAPRPPGLYWLCRSCEAKSKHLPINGLILSSKAPGQKAFMAASVPLTKENWVALAEGEIVVCKNGQVVPREALG